MVELANGGILDGAHPELWIGPSHVGGGVAGILDTHDYSTDGCFSVNSFEYFFDAGEIGYIRFIDDVLTIASDLRPMTGAISLRFMSASKAKVAMQPFNRTVSIEVAVPRPGSDNPTYFERVAAAAESRGARLHWGQRH